MIDELGFDEFGRPCKDLYLMNLCFDIRLRSIDPSTKCGCVAANKDGGILSTGYNNPPRNCDDSKVLLMGRPEKYFLYEHSERNCIYNAAENGVSLKNSVFIITGFPCYDCLRGIIQVGASKIIYGPNQAKMTAGDDYFKYYPILMEGQSLKIEKFKYLKGLYKLKPELEECYRGKPDINLEF